MGPDNPQLPNWMLLQFLLRLRHGCQRPGSIRLLRAQFTADRFQRRSGRRDSFVELSALRLGCRQVEPGLSKFALLRNPHRQRGEQHQQNQCCLVDAHC